MSNDDWRDQVAWGVQPRKGFMENKKEDMEKEYTVKELSEHISNTEMRVRQDEKRKWFVIIAALKAKNPQYSNALCDLLIRYGEQESGIYRND